MVSGYAFCLNPCHDIVRMWARLFSTASSNIVCGYVAILIAWVRQAGRQAGRQAHTTRPSKSKVQHNTKSMNAEFKTQ